MLWSIHTQQILFITIEDAWGLGYMAEIIIRNEKLNDGDES